jgi:hypothetical protein
MFKLKTFLLSTVIFFVISFGAFAQGKPSMGPSPSYEEVGYPSSYEKSPIEILVKLSNVTDITTVGSEVLIKGNHCVILLHFKTPIDEYRAQKVYGAKEGELPVDIIFEEYALSLLFTRGIEDVERVSDYSLALTLAPLFTWEEVKSEVRNQTVNFISGMIHYEPVTREIRESSQVGYNR